MTDTPTPPADDIVAHLEAATPDHGSSYLAELCAEAAAALRQRHATIAELRREKSDLEATFDMQWSADQRAIRQWQEATRRTRTWPDRADMVVWLLERLDAAEARVKDLEAERDLYLEYSGRAHVRAERCEDRAETLQRRLDEALEVLRPFVRLADDIEAATKRYDGPLSDPDNWVKDCAWEDLVAARAVVQRAGKGNS